MTRIAIGGACHLADGERRRIRAAAAVQRGRRDHGSLASQLEGRRGQQENLRRARRHADQARRFRDREFPGRQRVPASARRLAAVDRRHRRHGDQPCRLPGAERAGGVRQVAGRRRADRDGQDDNGPRTDQAWVTTADGLRIEILEDKAQTVPIQHHHVHFYVAEAAIPDIQAWYVKHFGAVAGMRGKFQAADIPGAEPDLHQDPTRRPSPTLGRVLDHIGFDVKDMDATVKRLDRRPASSSTGQC